MVMRAKIIILIRRCKITTEGDGRDANRDNGNENEVYDGDADDNHTAGDHNNVEDNDKSNGGSNNAHITFSNS